MTTLDLRPAPEPAAVSRAVRLLVSQHGFGDPARACDRLCQWIDHQQDPACALGALLGMDKGELLALAGPEADVTTAPLVERAGMVPEALRVAGRVFQIRPVLDPPGLSSRDRWQAHAALWLRNGGVLILLFLAFQWWGTNFQQHRTQARFQAEYHASSTRAGTSSGAVLTGAAPVPAPLPHGSVALLQIPAIHLEQFVVEGTSVGNLEQGPGHYVGTPFPGQPGNAAIAGHRTTYGAPFNRLNDLVPGDTIVATTNLGQYLYVVSAKKTVGPNDSAVLGTFGDSRLTLTTCTPEFFATQRLIVVARLVGPASASVNAKVTAPSPPSERPLTQSVAVTAHLQAEARTGFAWSGFVPVLIGLFFVVGLGLAWRPVRRFLPPLATFVVLVPVWAGAILYLFEQLTHFLPPSV